jgi:hypothetical protein
MSSNFCVGVTFTIEEMYNVDADTYEEAEEKARAEFEADFSGVPFWAGDTPQATVYEEIPNDDDD